MAEIVYQKRKLAIVPSDTNLLIIVLSILLCHSTNGQAINRAPHFIPQTGDMTQFSLLENTSVGTPVYQLKGLDPENGQLQYSISGQYFMVDPQTGVVTLVKALDREVQNKLEVIISLTDEAIGNSEPNTISLRRVIAVKDINDNVPIFLNRPYTVNVSEATPVGVEIQVTPKIIVTDKDEGVNAEIHVTCSVDEKGSDVQACSTFKVVTDKISLTEYQVRLFLQEPLDYESRSAFIISLVAKDLSEKPLKAVASVAVSVWDIQDQPPIFVNGPYSATVPENTVAGTSIMEIIARDGDTNNPRSILLLPENDIEEYFEIIIEEETGKAILITTDVPIDRESEIVAQNGGVYYFDIKAVELINNEVPSDYTVTQVTIIVTDVDDHVPIFNKDSFNISIPENIENGSPIPGLSIYVEDYDIGTNSKYDLSLRDVFRSEGVFSLSTDHGEGRTPLSIKVKDSSKLDYDVDDDDLRTFKFDIVTSVNNVELSSARVNVKLFDINDNTPIFDMSSYKFSVLENATTGFFIGDVKATDKDYGIFGDIEYSLTGFGSNVFKTDKNNGGLYLNYPVDYEKQKTYSLTLMAMDGGNKVTTASLFVDVLDVNDNAPVFDLPEYTRTIRDAAESFEPQFIIRATDIDGPTQGRGKIKYSIQHDNSISNFGNVFKIDDVTGELKIINRVDSMDTPRGQYELVVRATDYGNPPLSNDTKVFIRVGVPGNQRPTFKGNYHNYKYQNTHRSPTSEEDFTFDLNPMNYKASIREDAQPGDVVTTVVANDPDGLDHLLKYHIVSGSKDNFVINEISGLITVSNDANLDRDLNADKYEIIVAAVDSGTPIPETATTTVYVNIEDVNNKPPKFNNTESKTYISEKTKIGDRVTTMIAHDPDLDAKLKYSIIEPIKAFSKAGVPLKPNSSYKYRSLFKINEDTGEISVNGTLDYSKASIVILTVKVVDSNAKVYIAKQNDVIEHTIYIQPFEDKNPQFTNAGWTTSNPIIYQKVKEGQPIGSTVLALSAEDPVSGHLVSSFKVVKSETGLLQVDPLSGQVVLTAHLDYEELTSPNLTISVKAFSSDGSRSSMAKLIIEIINLNDNAPVFEKTSYKVSIQESSKYPAQILTVKATDADAVLTNEDKASGFSDIRYSLSSENSDLFIIDEINGVIRIAENKTLDRERQSVLVLEVIATDTPKGGSDRLSSRATIIIDVLDVDDNTPTFEKNIYTAVVPENVAIGADVIRVSANDPDEGIGGEIKYEFLDEGEANGLFAIDQNTGDLSTKKDLTGRGRTEPYILLIGATDGGGHSGDASMHIYIGDVSANDGVPRFIKPAPEEVLKVSENATIGSPVYQVFASDPDDPAQPSGKLYYSIQQSNADAKTFAIDSQTGIISTREPLDRERKSSYTLVLEVWDRGDPPQHSARVVTVSVDDVDDHKPHFVRNLDDPALQMSINEEVPIDSTVGILEAVDEDINENGAIDYIITAGNDLNLFKLERTNDSKGIIKTAARLDRESIAKVLLTIKCFKHNTKPKVSKSYNRLDPSEIQVLIKILDVDDHLPEFESHNITVGVKLNIPTDTVITTVKATDKDPDAQAMDYKIVNVTFESPIKKNYSKIYDVIGINNVTGDLKIMKSLLHYSDGIFRLVVRANNSRDQDRFTDSLVEVVIVRERDLLRLIWGGNSRGGRGRVSTFIARSDTVLAPLGLKLQIHDTVPTATGACFQIRKTDTGEALTPKAMKATIRTLGSEFQNILETTGVRNVTSCAESRARHTASQHALLGLAGVLPLAAFVAVIVLCAMYSNGDRITTYHVESSIFGLVKCGSRARHTASQHALLGLAGVLPLAAFVAVIVLCAMYSNAKKRSRRALLMHREAPPITGSHMSIPSRLYAEPLYST